MTAAAAVKSMGLEPSFAVSKRFADDQKPSADVIPRPRPSTAVWLYKECSALSAHD